MGAVTGSATESKARPTEARKPNDATSRLETDEALS